MIQVNNKSDFLQIFLLNPDFLLVLRNRYLVVTDDRQITLRGYPNFDSYVKNLCVLVFRMDGQIDRQTDGEINPVWAG
jgi:hypothetical protein